MQMFRAATALIVIGLTGIPIAQLTCDARCQMESHSSNATDAACLRVLHESGQAEATRDTCARVAGSDQFVTPAPYRALPIAAGPSLVAAGSASLLDLHHHAGTFQLSGDPRPPQGARVTVLRI